MNNYWSSKDSAIRVSSKLPSSPAIGYSKPDIRKVAVQISSDEEEFIPSYSDKSNTADLFAKLPDGDLLLPTGASDSIDCGFRIELPPGYRICIESSISNVFLNLIESDRIKVNILNLGKELILQNKKKIGKIWIEPVYFFDWITKG